MSRSFGLGTKLPVDSKFIIDSLSDSTIYPAYYTISHVLHSDLYGQSSSFNPADFTDQVWDYIFLSIDFDESFTTPIPIDKLDLMRKSFHYFYPVDVRISGKDLLKNHLGMYLFNHVAIFEPKHWPVSINCNGWVLVDGEKMSKSKGNFITIESATETNSIDAVRMTLADSGDNMEDANYVTANAGDHSTLKLFSWIESFDKYFEQAQDHELSPLDSMFFSVFNRLLGQIVSHYENHRYKMVIRDGFHNFNNLKEKYRIYSKYLNQPINLKLLEYICSRQVQVLYPIIPHLASYVWSQVMKKIEPIQSSNLTSEANLINDHELKQFDDVEEVCNGIRDKTERLRKKNKPINKVVVLGQNQYDQLIETLIKSQFKFLVEFELGDKSNVIVS